MKLIDGIKIKGRPAEIPDCSRDDLPEFFNELGFKSGVEIGVESGGFTELFAKSGLTIYGVDPWKSYDDFGSPSSQRMRDRQYRQVLTKLVPYPNTKIIRKTSMEAAVDFPNESLDFVYIDGNHSFKYVAEDICEWTKKIKKGGIISGHDYIYSRPIHNNFHVHQVVDAYVNAFGIRNFWILGRKLYKDGERRDRWRSWMWFKQ